MSMQLTDSLKNLLNRTANKFEATYRHYSSQVIVPYYHVLPPTNCEKLESIISHFGGSMQLQHYNSQVHYSLPVHCTRELHTFFSQFTNITFTQEYVGLLPHGRVFGSGVVISPDGKTIARDVSIDFRQPFETHWLLHVKRLKRPKLLTGKTAVIAVESSPSNYYHWLLDELPRLLILERDEFNTMIASNSNPYNRDALKLYGFNGKIISPNSHFQCDELVVPSLVGSTGHPTPKVVDLISIFVEPLLNSTSSFGEKIYISRENAKLRKISNEEQLWSNLKARGFNKLKLEEMTWVEQIGAFSHARVIVAPHGAGLANLVFCRPGTKVVEFFNRSYVHWCYWQLASIKGLDYRPVVPSGDEELSHKGSALISDLQVDCHQIITALSE